MGKSGIQHSLPMRRCHRNRPSTSGAPSGVMEWRGAPVGAQQLPTTAAKSSATNPPIRHWNVGEKNILKSARFPCYCLYILRPEIDYGLLRVVYDSFFLIYYIFSLALLLHNSLLGIATVLSKLFAWK